VLAIDRERKPEWQPLYIALEFLNGYANLMFRTKLFYTKIPYILKIRQLKTIPESVILQTMGKGGWHIQIDSDEYF
jgi:hypothetical protein